MRILFGAVALITGFTPAVLAATCTYALDPPNAGIAATGGTGSFHVISDPRCGWAATSNVPWIQVLTAPGSVQFGSGTVSFSVEANTAATPRTGTVTIMGQTFTLSENGAGVKIGLTVFGNAASYVSSVVAPGELIVFGGTGLGPPDIVAFAPGPETQDYPTTLAGTRVYFDGIPAPVIYTREDIVSAVVPFGVGVKTSTQVAVEYNGNWTNTMKLNVAPTMPGIFTLDASGTGQAVALQFLRGGTWSINTAANPAPEGAVMVFWVTGLGGTYPASIDGRITPPVWPYPALREALKVKIGGIEAPVQYAGPAPATISGVSQINVAIPPGVTPGVSVPVLVLTSNTSSQQNLTIAVK